MIINIRLLIINIFILTSLCNAKNLDFDVLHKNMIEQQIKQRGIKNASVLNALSEVKRHHFVSEKYKKFAYSDHPLPIGSGQTISQPYIVALMTEKLNIQKNHKVLEIGTGSGYQAAILSRLASLIYSIEIIPKLAKNAKKILKANKYENIIIKVGDGYYGLPEYAPFDRIIVTAAPEKIPQNLIDQLAIGGKMVIPVGQKYKTQYLWLLTKEKNGSIKKEKILPVRFVPMVKKVLN